MRGRRSQVAWSRRLGYRSNVAYTWESGRRWPTAAETFRAIRRSGLDLDGGLVGFYGREPTWLEDTDPASPEAVARLLDDLRGTVSITDLARRSGQSRYSVSRWLSASTQPRLPDFFCLVEAASVRLVDLVTSFVEPRFLPSVLPIFRRLEARRKGAFQQPWTSAVLMALELDAYKKLPAHDDAWVAAVLGLDEATVSDCVSFMDETGQIRRKSNRYERERLAVDTRRHPEIGRALQAHWSGVARDRIQAEAPGQFSYNVFTVSRADFERIRELHLRYFHELRSIVAESEPEEMVAVANVQLFGLQNSPGKV